MLIEEEPTTDGERLKITTKMNESTNNYEIWKMSNATNAKRKGTMPTNAQIKGKILRFDPTKVTPVQ
jgi:hypothetical protein